jgi:hypothetical protein
MVLRPKDKQWLTYVRPQVTERKMEVIMKEIIWPPKNSIERLMVILCL